MRAQTFKDKEWDERVGTLGDPAETAFEQWATTNGIGFVRSGLNRPPFELGALQPMTLYTPDYLTAGGYIEVQGCGKDGLFKFKHDKLNALRRWEEQEEVLVWLWDQPANTCVLIGLDQIQMHCWDNGDAYKYRTDGMFDGRKPYVSVPSARLRMERCVA